MSFVDYVKSLPLPQTAQHIIMTAVIVGATLFAIWAWADELTDDVKENSDKITELEKVGEDVDQLKEDVQAIKAEQQIISTKIDMEAEHNEEFREDINNKIDLILQKID